MKTSCKSCQNWTRTDGDMGWCANFKKDMFNTSLCGEWRARKVAQQIPPGPGGLMEAPSGRLAGRTNKPRVSEIQREGPCSLYFS